MADAKQAKNEISDTQASPANDDNGVAHAGAGSATDALHHGDIVSAPVTDLDLPGDQYLLATNTISSDAFGSVDHALHQLTIVTDLFDVPVIDFYDHGS